MPELFGRPGKPVTKATGMTGERAGQNGAGNLGTAWDRCVLLCAMSLGFFWSEDQLTIRSFQVISKSDDPFFHMIHGDLW